ncbi:MAG: DEAD/DEAH box helicase family protein [Vulcanibacillus sp.]
MNFNLYLVENSQKLTWLISSDINVDLTFWHQKGVINIIILTKKLSIGHANALALHLQQKGLFSLSALSKEELETENLFTKDGFDLFNANYQSFKKIIFPLLEGRLLLLDELSKLDFIEEVPKEKLYQLLQTGYLLENIKINPSVSYPYDIARKKFTINKECNHCGTNKNIIVQRCSICEDYCATCENCVTMGKSKSCIPLFYFSIENNPSIKLAQSNKVSMIDLQLSNSQKKISDKIVDFIKNGNNKEFLIWAVTGSGKTEMVFFAIKCALEKGDKVLFTAPRRDIIKDLTIRFKNSFPNLSIVSLYGGSEDRWKVGSLYLATAQQTIRFINYFDLAIIDELDAYPYHNNLELQYLVKRSLKYGGKTVLMSATPPNEWLIRIKQKTIDYEVLSSRYHGQPLPTPTIKIIPNKIELLKRKSPFSKIKDFISEVKKVDGKALIFVSGVKDIEIWVDKLIAWFPTEKIGGVHANDLNRDRKIDLFRAGEIRYLVTTTILERGVTFPNLHILILNAEAKIFDEATLVQIAGRVGRSAEFPRGLVWFLAEYMTKDLHGAKKQINKMNYLAKKQLM